jgi:hypothetical protein
MVVLIERKAQVSIVTKDKVIGVRSSYTSMVSISQVTSYQTETDTNLSYYQ